MKLSAPTQGIFIASVVLVILGLLGFLDILPQLGAYAYGLTLVGYVLLLVGNLAKGL